MQELPRSVRFVYTVLLPGKFRSALENVVRGRYPRIYDRKKFIFIHIPKTAGKALARVLGSGGACHLGYREYRELLGEKINEYFIFTVVREPLDRLKSAYAYLRAGGNGSHEDRRFRRQWIVPCSDFQDFVLNALAVAPVSQHYAFRPQSDYIIDEQGRLATDVHVMRFESLQEDFRPVAERLGVSGDLKRVNLSERNGIDFSLSSAALDVVRKFYAADYRNLDYAEP